MFILQKRSLVLLIIIFMTATYLVGCGNNVTSNETDSNKANTEVEPSTIVVTYFPYADHLFALGQAEQLSGVVNLKSLQQFSVYDSFLKAGTIKDLGEAVNLESISSLNPDLIIVSQNEEQYVSQLSKIAKTVTIPATLNWQETITGVAAAIGQEASAEAYISQFQSLQSDTIAAMEKSGIKGKTALFAMPWEHSFTYWGSTRMSLYYDKLGFKPADDLEKVSEISLEGIIALNPDFIFMGKDFSNSSDIKLEELANDPVWKSLHAVKNGNVYFVDTEILGPLAMGQYKGLEYMKQLFAK